MHDPSPRIPDSIEPISAYRAWFYSIEGRTAQLFPLSGASMGHDWQGAGATWVTASCPRFGAPTHEVPSESCSCGFYSLKDLDLAVDHTGILHLMTIQGHGPGQVVLGRILLSGKVIEHESGYRAERARIAELIPFRGTERSIMVLAHRLGVGMAPAVEPRAPQDVLALVTPRPRPDRRSQDPPDPMRSPAAGVLAIVGLIAASIIVLAGGPPLIPLVTVSILQLGRSSDSMAKAYRDLRDWRSGGLNRPRFLPPVPPPAG